MKQVRSIEVCAPQSAPNSPFPRDKGQVAGGGQILAHEGLAGGQTDGRCTVFPRGLLLSQGTCSSAVVSVGR